MNKKQILSFVVLACASNLIPSSPAYLKGSSSHFAPASRHLDPIMGAVAWESGAVKNMYRLALNTPMTRERWLTHPDGPVRLSYALFSLNQGNFDVSTNTNYPGKHQGVSTLATIIVLVERARRGVAPLKIGMLEDMIIQDPEFSQSVKATQQDYEQTEKIYMQRIKNLEQELKTSSEQGPLTEQLAKIKESKIIALNKLDTQRLYQDWSRAQARNAAQARIAEIDQLVGTDKQKAQKERAQKIKLLEGLKKSQAGDYNRVRELAQAVIDAIQLTDTFPVNCAQWLLLSCLYRKAKCKQDIGRYIEILAQELGHNVCHAPSPEWVTDCYQETDLEYIKACIQKDATLETVIAPAIYESIACAQIIERFYKGTVPKMAEYATIRIKDIPIADCVETTIRNICNLALYDKKSATFDIRNSPTGYVDEILATFYGDEQRSQAIYIGAQDSYNTWGPLLQDQPFLTYRRMILSDPSGTCLVLTASKDHNGFIYGLSEETLSALPHEKDKVLIAGRWYTHVDHKQVYLCEMHPTMRNFIIVLDRLFKLNLFKHESLESAFLSETFSARYFPQLCAFFDIFKNINKNQEALQSLDTNEYAKTPLMLHWPLCDLLLTQDHAEITTHAQTSSIADLGPSLLKNIPVDREQYWLQAHLAALFPFKVTDLQAHNPLPYLIYLDTHDYCNIIHACALCCNIAIHSADARCVDHAAMYIKMLPCRLDWYYHVQLINQLEPQAFKLDPIKKAFDAIVLIAKDRLSGGLSDREGGPFLMRALVNKGYYYQDAFELARNYAASIDKFEQKRSLKILTALAKQGQALEQSRAYAEQFLNSPSTGITKHAAQLKQIIDASA